MTDKRYYMACLDLEGRQCLVVGGGSVGVHAVRFQQILGDLELGAVEAEGGVGGGLVG